MERISCYILALLIFAFVALTNTSCTNTTDAKPAITSSAITDTAETAAEPDRLDELGKKNFDGRVFTILDANDHPYMHINLPGESLNGDIVNDGLFNRDLAIEEKYNVDIQYIQITNAKAGTDSIKNAFSRMTVLIQSAFRRCSAVLSVRLHPKVY